MLPVNVDATGTVSVAAVTNANVSGNLSAGGDVSIQSDSNRLRSNGSVVIDSGGSIDIDGPLAGNGGMPNLRMAAPSGTISIDSPVSVISAFDISDGSGGVGADTVSLEGAVTAGSIDILATTQTDANVLTTTVGDLSVSSPMIGFPHGGPDRGACFGSGCNLA